MYCLDRTVRQVRTCTWIPTTTINHHTLVMLVTWELSAQILYRFCPLDMSDLEEPLTFNRKLGVKTRLFLIESNAAPSPETVHSIAEFSGSFTLLLSSKLALTFALVEVAIHTILYVRQVYPADIFVRRKKYDTPVFQSRHPALNEYISGVVKAIADELVHVSISCYPHSIYYQFLNRVKLTKLWLSLKTRSR